MKHLYFIGMSDCGICNVMRREQIEPLQTKHPEQVHILYEWCPDLARINGRKVVDDVPLIVIEDDGEETFRFHGNLPQEELNSLLGGEAANE